MVLTWFEKLNDWLPERILQKKDLVVITSGKVGSPRVADGHMYAESFLEVLITQLPIVVGERAPSRDCGNLNV